MPIRLLPENWNAGCLIKIADGFELLAADQLLPAGRRPQSPNMLVFG
jgi:hypothetical protein